METTEELVEIDQALFEEIKAAQEDGINSADVAEQMEVPFELVNKVFASKNFRNYVVAENGIGKQKEIVENEKLNPARAAYYTGLVAKKYEENANLKEMRGWLMEQVSYLRKVVSFLEFRKAELERAIAQLEKNILTGVSAIEQIEETKNFTELSETILWAEFRPLRR